MDRYKASTIKDGILVHANISNLPIRKGMFVVFDADFLTLRINDFSSYKIEKHFKNIEAPNKIHIFEECFEFSENDYVDIYYDEYEFFGYDKVLNREGKIYKNQTFTPEGNLESEGKKTILHVENISETDLDLEVTEKGLYPSPPDQDIFFVAENGARIQIDHFYRRSSVKNYKTNLIKNIIYGDKFIILDLLNDLPKNVKDGIVVTNKILIKTDKDLSEIKRNNEFFYIVSNKLPYMNLPFPEIEDETASKMFEDILLKIDKKFSELDKTIQEIKGKGL
jgi:hypothetical protein